MYSHKHKSLSTRERCKKQHFNCWDYCRLGFFSSSSSQKEQVGRMNVERGKPIYISMWIKEEINRISQHFHANNQIFFAGLVRCEKLLSDFEYIHFLEISYPLWAAADMFGSIVYGFLSVLLSLPLSSFIETNELISSAIEISIPHSLCLERVLSYFNRHEKTNNFFFRNEKAVFLKILCNHFNYKLLCICHREK